MNKYTAGTQTECKHGHPYPEHRGTDRNGHHFCLRCRERWYADRRARVRAEAARRKASLVDETILEMIRTGASVASLTVQERALAVAILDAWGLPASEISRRIGCSKRTVHRVRARRRSADTAWADALAELEETSA